VSLLFLPSPGCGIVGSLPAKPGSEDAEIRIAGDPAWTAGRTHNIIASEALAL
jgi:hypothetical protein